MKNILLLSIICVGLSVSAQLNLNNDTIDIIVHEGENYINEGKVEITNNKTSGKLTYDYHIFTDEFKTTPSWTVQFCDCEQCLENYAATGTCKDLAAGEKWYFIVDVITKKAVDGKFFSLAFSNPNDAMDKDTITFKTKIGNLLGVQKQLINSANLNVSPNPATDNMQISFNTIQGVEYNLSLFNILGETVLKDNIEDNNGTFKKELNVSEFKQGIYFVVLSNGKETVIEKLVIN